MSRLDAARDLARDLEMRIDARGGRFYLFDQRKRRADPTPRTLDELEEALLEAAELEKPLEREG